MFVMFIIITQHIMPQLTNLIIYSHTKTIPPFTSLPQPMNSSSQPSQQAPQNPTRPKFTKYPSQSTPTPGPSPIRKQNSIDQFLHRGESFDPQHALIRRSIGSRITSKANSQHDGSGMLSNIRSESSLAGSKGSKSKRVPFTPKKERLVVGGINKRQGRSSLNQVVIKIKVLLKEFQRVLVAIQNKIKQTVGIIMEDMERQVKKYLLNSSGKTETFGNIEKQQKVEQKQGQKIRNIDRLRQLQTFDQSVQANLINLQTEVKLNASRQGTPEKNPQGKAHLFSNMIHLRQKLRKDATSTKLKGQTNGLPESIPQTPIKQRTPPRLTIEPRPQNSPSGRKQMTKSIEKLQNQLKSLKNILNQR